MGIVEKVILLEDGEILDLDKNTAVKNGKVTTGRVCIDSGGSIEVVEDVVIRDRQHISEDGILLPIIAINKAPDRWRRLPELVMRGFAVDDRTGHQRSAGHRAEDA